MAPDPSRSIRKLRKLSMVLKGQAEMLILIQDNPDPDALASAAALREVAHHVSEVRCTLAYGGTIGRAENRELVHYLGLPFRRYADDVQGGARAVALVDTQPGTGNNPLPPDARVDVVIDHHPVRRASRGVPFTDIRSRYGATATILVEYLLAAGIVPERPLATALLYGIRSDTQDLERESTQADVEAMEWLYPLANKRMLGQIQRGRVPGTYYRMLATALARARRHGALVISELGDVDNPDMIGEVADLLLRHEDALWSACLGFFEGRCLLSLRTQDSHARAGDLMRSLVARIGTGGGHAGMAGGQVPLRGGPQPAAEKARVAALLRRRLREALGVLHVSGIPLAPGPEPAPGG